MKIQPKVDRMFCFNFLKTQRRKNEANRIPFFGPDSDSVETKMKYFSCEKTLDFLLVIYFNRPNFMIGLGGERKDRKKERNEIGQGKRCQKK